MSTPIESFKQKYPDTIVVIDTRNGRRKVALIKNGKTTVRDRGELKQVKPCPVCGRLLCNGLCLGC